ncbi:hypothetical protein K491DRAFT_691738 [Lophiostoma macrostomum CBS 122681]|uniref:Uncharacterized protein n=1 Tax=Lophiostoma macrostomum CBS 122681 TaxID=1314788 RepID=A0A6A6T9P9_9PLEO|nr:hypothetical protein K491DRAFT_691738 [Lophiostoma macrostomum CBS 122681]
MRSSALLARGLQGRGRCSPSASPAPCHHHSRTQRPVTAASLSLCLAVRSHTCRRSLSVEGLVTCQPIQL